MQTLHTPALLVIMDGFGLAEPGPGNAISLANTPYLDALLGEAPMCKLEASGEAVGLPAGQMGNSEVGPIIPATQMPITRNALICFRAC